MPIILLAVPLALSAYTHLWNPGGFPSWLGDETIYIQRAMGVLDHDILYGKYDHPFFGQAVLAGFMYVVGYPVLYLTSTDPSSLGMFYAIPRVFMGLLAVLDTFLVYKITEKWFGRRAAPVAAVLFAAMPISLMLRMVLLDSILLPFVLASVLLAIHARIADRESDPPGSNIGSNGGRETLGIVLHAKYRGRAGQYVPGERTPFWTGASMGRASHLIHNVCSPDKTQMLIVMSGACMGCAILTKVPSLAMIPLVFALVYSAGRRPRQAMLWLVPVVVIAAVWPASAMLAGEFDLWVDGVLGQADRNNQGKLDALRQHLPVALVQGQDPDVLTHPLILLVAVLQLFVVDPVLIALGTAGLAFAAVVRSRFLLMWAAPVLLFFGSIGLVSYFHLGMLWVAMCIAAAALISYGMGKASGGGQTKEGGAARCCWRLCLRLRRLACPHLACYSDEQKFLR